MTNEPRPPAEKQHTINERFGDGEWFHNGCEEELPDEEELKRDWFCLQCRV